MQGTRAEVQVPAKVQVLELLGCCRKQVQGLSRVQEQAQEDLKNKLINRNLGFAGSESV